MVCSVERVNILASMIETALSMPCASPCDLLCDGMFHLEAGIDLNEVVLPTLIHQELHGPSILVANVICQPHRIARHLVADFRGEIGSWRDLYDLLVPTLHGAVTLVEMDNIAVLITCTQNKHKCYTLENKNNQNAIKVTDIKQNKLTLMEVFFLTK